jgi:hypothetical protein
MSADTSLPAAPPGPARRFALARAAVYLSSVLLFLPCLLYPTLWYDDFTYLRESWTWALARQNLWQTFMEHTMPLARLYTWLLVQLAPNATSLPWILRLQGSASVWLDMLLIERFLARELDRPACALVGAALFGISLQYFQAVWWYAASFSLLALDTTLLALLAAQRFRKTKRYRWLGACALGAMLAPGWTSSGIVAGPLCVLYLLAREAPRPRLWWLAALAPLAGAFAYLCFSLPYQRNAIRSVAQSTGHTPSEAIQPLTGLRYTARALVDNVLLDNLLLNNEMLDALGLPRLFCPPSVVASVAPVLVLVAGLWWWCAPGRRLVLVGAGAIVASYLLIFSARALWEYETIRSWGRYHVFAHCGLALFLVGGLARWERLIANSHPALVAVVLVGLTLAQFPRAVKFPYEAAQRAQLLRVDEVDARCRQFHIDTDTACAVLPPTPMPGSDTDNAFRLLYGSSDPRPISLDEARPLLAP